MAQLRQEMEALRGNTASAGLHWEQQAAHPSSYELPLICSILGARLLILTWVQLSAAEKKALAAEERARLSQNSGLMQREAPPHGMPHGTRQ